MTKDLPHNHGQNIESIVFNSPSAEDCKIVSDSFRQLSDANRLRLFWFLCHCEECVINLAAMMEMSSPAISHHLRQLKVGGLITARRSGKEVYYRVANTPQAQALHEMIERQITISCPTHLTDSEE